MSICILIYVLISKVEQLFCKDFPQDIQLHLIVEIFLNTATQNLSTNTIHDALGHTIQALSKVEMCSLWR